MSALQHTPDNDLLARIKQGDEAAFTTLFYFYKDKLYSFIYGLTKSELKTQDILQDIFLKIWQNRESFSQVENLNAYIYTMARNVAFDSFRKLSNTVSALDELIAAADSEDLDESPDNRLIRKELLERVSGAIDQLPAQQRKVLEMSKKQGMKYSEIADELNISVWTVKNTLKQALVNLRKILFTTYPELYIVWLIFLIS
jgi:RNA polymerase sigma-70 factor (ECF subfamily)